jgi:hypothetical protein
MTYQNRVVFFFDILGFRDLVNKEFLKDTTKSEKIYEAFEFINKFYEDEIPDEYNPTKQITFFSDSVVISFVPDDPDTIFSTIATLQILLLNLANRGIVMRGGISVGQLFHDTKYIFGPAFIEAYDIESKIAKFPRIICDDSIVLLSQKGKALHSARQDLEIFTQIVRQDDDKYWYIDYIGNIESLFDTGYEQVDYLLKLYTFIVTNLKENRIESVLDKYNWMKEKYNNTATDILNNERLKDQDFDLYTYSKQLKLID